MAEFTLPSFLAGHSEEEIYQTMRDRLPGDIDSSEGSHVWNFLRPTAMVAAELCEFVLPGVVRSIFPEWSAGEFLDAHARARGLARKRAEPAAGDLSVTGRSGAVVPAGTRFSTLGGGETSAMEYVSTGDVTLSAEGAGTIPVVCAEAGTGGNTGAGTIVLIVTAGTGLTSVTNPAPVEDGTDEETDESLISRLLAYDQERGLSYVGSAADYRRWATGVDGTGGAIVLTDEEDVSAVTILLTDADGGPASAALCQTVYDTIMRPDDPYARLAPVNVSLTVRAPETVPVYISATVTPEAEASMDAVRADFLSGVRAYLPAALADGEVRLSRIGAILSGTAGVADHQGLMIGTASDALSTTNIPLTQVQLPVTAAEQITLTEG